jgi:HEAT repeat protein
MRFYQTAAFCFLAVLLQAQNIRTRDVRDVAREGSPAIPKLQEFLKNPDIDIRVETVKQLIQIGTQYSLDPLIQATRDNDPEVQARATDGLVNFYLPGYVQTGFGASIRRAGTSIKGRFTDTNDQVIDPYLTVRPDVIAALAALVRGGAGMEVRANAARGVGILRGRAAVDDLVDATRSKDTPLMYEAIIALQKIGDQTAGPRIRFLLHDLDPKVQIAAIETTGLLRAQESVPSLVDALNRARDIKVKRAALTAIAMLPSEQSRPLYQQYLRDRDERMRGAAAEGFARLRNPSDLPLIEQAWRDEGKTSPRLSLAFAMATLGRTELSEFSPLQYLINTLNSAAYEGESFAFLVELARDAKVRESLYGPLHAGTKDEKVGLSGVLARSGDSQSIPHLQKLTQDSDPEVAREALRAVRTLQAK